MNSFDGINLEDILDKQVLDSWKSDDIDFLKGILIKNLFPKEKKEIVEYIENTRILNERVSARPGLFSFSVTPYLREIIRNLDENCPIQYIDFMKGAQIGSTVGLDENFIIYLIGNSPAPILFLASTSEVAEQIFTLRINPSIEESGLSHLIKATTKNKKSRETGNTRSYKSFDGGFIQIGGLQSISKLKSFSIKVLIITEADESKTDVGGQGNAITLAERRTDAYSLNRKILIESTPKMASGESYIEGRFLMGDQRYYHVPCKHCKQLQKLDFNQLKYSVDDDGILIPSSVHYECIYCGGSWKEIDKQYFLGGEEDGGLAKWIPTAKSKDPKRRSYHLSSLYAPIGFRSWESIIYDYLKAVESEKNGDNSFMKVFANTVLGIPYKSIEEAPPYELIYEKNRGNYLAEEFNDLGQIKQSTLNVDELPYKPLYCNIAVDIQKRYIEAGVYLWCEGYRGYMIGYHRFDGDTSNLQSRCWWLLEQLIKAEHLGFYASIVFIDKGFIPAVVSEFCQNMYYETKSLGSIVFPIKGDSTGLLFAEQKVVDNKDVASITVNSSLAKDKAYHSLSLEKVENDIPPNYVYFPNNMKMDFFRMLTAEEKIKKYNKNGAEKYEWQLRQGQKRNEALDIFGYSIVASNFYINVLAPKDKDGNLDYNSVWEYLKGEGAEFEKLNKFEYAQKK